MSDAPIGVFDSGVGGLSVLREIRSLLPSEELLYVADSGAAPYGDRSEAFIRDRVGGLPACAGVAMLPLSVAGRVYALAELGRADHPFRGADQAHLRGVLDAMSDRLAVIRNP